MISVGAYSQHFSSGELACKGKTCGPYKNGCQQNRSTTELVRALELLRIDVNYGNPNGSTPVIILDATRCDEHNAQVSGAASDSQHPKGTAADFRVPGFTAVQLEEIALKHTDIIRGIGRNDKGAWIHIDVRVANVVARWCYDEHGRWTKWFAPSASVAVEA